MNSHFCSGQIERKCGRFSFSPKRKKGPVDMPDPLFFHREWAQVHFLIVKECCVKSQYKVLIHDLLAQLRVFQFLGRFESIYENGTVLCGDTSVSCHASCTSL